MGKTVDCWTFLFSTWFLSWSSQWHDEWIEETDELLVFYLLVNMTCFRKNLRIIKFITFVIHAHQCHVTPEEMGVTCEGRCGMLCWIFFKVAPPTINLQRKEREHIITKRVRVRVVKERIKDSQPEPGKPFVMSLILSHAKSHICSPSFTG